MNDPMAGGPISFDPHPTTPVMRTYVGSDYTRRWAENDTSTPQSIVIDHIELRMRVDGKPATEECLIDILVRRIDPGRAQLSVCELHLQGLAADASARPHRQHNRPARRNGLHGGRRHSYSPCPGGNDEGQQRRLDTGEVPKRIRDNRSHKSLTWSATHHELPTQN
jgi:hypothetical protein